jgi:hypothetical protein
VVAESSALERWDATRLLSVLAGALLIAFLVILGFRVFGDGTAGSHAVPRLHERDIVTAAQAATTAFLDVDYSDMGPRMDKVLSLATGTFYDRYKAAEDELAAVTTEGRVKSEGTVRYIGLSKVTDTTAVVYVAADSTVTNTKTSVIDPSGSTDERRHYRFRVELRRVKGTWLVSGLEFVR